MFDVTEYREGIEKIREVTMARAVPKHLGGSVLTGTIMAQLLPKLAVALNDMDSVGPALIMQMARVLAEECFKQFKVTLLSCVAIFHRPQSCSRLIMWIIASYRRLVYCHV